MSVEELRERREALDRRRADADAELERVRLELRLLSTYCSHPNSYAYSAMGEMGQKCPDCGYQT